MVETDITFHYLYNAAREFYEKQDFHKAFDFYKTALQIRTDYAVVWQETGYTLMRLRRMAEAGIYFRRALHEYDQPHNESMPLDKKMYLKACLYALLEEKENALECLKIAIDDNISFLKKAQNEPDFISIQEEEDFLQLIHIEENKKTLSKERGEKISKNEMTEDELKEREFFIDAFLQNQWKMDILEYSFDQNIPISPQAYIYFEKNPNFIITLSYYFDKKCILLELFSKKDELENQICILKTHNIAQLVLPIIQKQDTLSDESWTELLEELIDICEEVILEMPDGRKVKL